MRSLCALACLAILAGCSVEQGGRILQPVPSGTVQVYLLSGNGTALASGPKHPVFVHGGFSLNVTEAWYTNYFTATVVSYTAPGGPCIVAPSQPNNTVLTFTVKNGNVCYPGNGDVEGIRVIDVFGNSSTQYFELK